MKLAVVAVLALTATATAQERYLVFRQGHAYWINEDGRGGASVGTRLLPGALLSPDARKWAGVTEGRLWIANGSEKQELATGVAGDIRWTLDGTGLLFAAGKDIHLVDVATKEVHRLTKSVAPLRRPALDASGSWLVYLQGKDLVLKHLVTHAERVLLRDAERAVYAWSPKPGNLAWADGAGLHLLDVHTGKRVRRPNPVALAETRELAWTPTGEAVGVRNGRTIHVVHREKKARTIVVPKGSDPAPVRWQLLMFDG